MAAVITLVRLVLFCLVSEAPSSPLPKASCSSRLEFHCNSSLLLYAQLTLLGGRVSGTCSNGEPAGSLRDTIRRELNLGLSEGL